MPDYRIETISPTMTLVLDADDQSKVIGHVEKRRPGAYRARLARKPYAKSRPPKPSAWEESFQELPRAFSDRATAIWALRIAHQHQDKPSE